MEWEWDLFGSKNAKIKKFHTKYSLDFSGILWDCRHPEGSESDNFDYVKVTPLWTFLGTKLTYFIYLVSLFCFRGSCIVRTEGPSLLLTFCMGF